jgi:hypothetical protein
VNPRRLALALSCLLVAATVLAVLAWRLDRTPAAGAADARVESAGRAVEALAVLRGWDDRRARAWATSDVAGLGRLYTAGSRTGRHDGALLEAYADRGLRVPGLRMQVFAVAVRSWTADELTLLVTDRVAGGVAVGAGVRVPLPADRPSTRLVSFVQVAGEWRVEEVQARAATRTSSTWRSSNR